ncbi:MAG TPA: hypothetical protein DD727_08275, partial [Clostridiales bacterium]|nr:hypothetical protein [Clostridiales bacterium]
WSAQRGGVAYRGIRTSRYTYVKTKEKPWMLFDNQEDPCQLQNRVDDPAMGSLCRHLNGQLQRILEQQGDEFLSPEELAAKHGFHGLDAGDSIPTEKGEEWYIQAAKLRETAGRN